MNSFGQLFRITTFGESHGKGIGVVIDGCPPGLALSEEVIAEELSKRRPGKNRWVSPRQEADVPQILSGVWEGKTTGAPLAIWVANCDAKGESYQGLEGVYRPGHANFTYLQKYGIFDPRGGGRASARETLARVAAGAVAKIFLRERGIDLVAFVQQVGEEAYALEDLSIEALREKRDKSCVFCPGGGASTRMEKRLSAVMEEGDSCGGIVQCLLRVPPGLGEPIYGKIDALLAFAMLSIPATKGFSIGEGFSAAKMKGSMHNDPFFQDASGKIRPKTNLAGGVLGGISTGETISFHVAFKPTSSIAQKQETVTLQGKSATLELPPGSRHDPCVAIRGAIVVEAMAALVVADLVLRLKNS